MPIQCLTITDNCTGDARSHSSYYQWSHPPQLVWCQIFNARQSQSSGNPLTENVWSLFTTQSMSPAFFLHYSNLLLTHSCRSCTLPHHTLFPLQVCYRLCKTLLDFCSNPKLNAIILTVKNKSLPPIFLQANRTLCPNCEWWTFKTNTLHRSNSTRLLWSSRYFIPPLNKIWEWKSILCVWCWWV